MSAPARSTLRPSDFQKSGLAFSVNNHLGGEASITLYESHAGLESPCKGICAWCNEECEGPASTVILWQAEHRTSCPSAPPPPKYTLQQKRRMRDVDARMEKERMVTVAREGVQARATARDEKSRRDHEAKQRTDERIQREREARDQAIRDLHARGNLTLQGMADALTAQGIPTARGRTVWAEGNVSGILKRLGLRQYPSGYQSRAAKRKKARQ